jgi:CheY-like chemotaxis protein
MCVLVVEDDTTLGKLFLLHLKQLGYTADLAPTAQDAIEQVKRKAYGLIIMDIGLPDKDGLETTEEIRHIPNNLPAENVPIVAITAGHATRDECMKVGMNDYFQKPVLLDEFARILQKWNPEKCRTGQKSDRDKSA